MSGHHSHGPVAAPADPSTAGTALSISPLAAAKLKDLLLKEGKDLAVTGLRLGVQGGGCSGYSYFMDFDTARPDDEVAERDGVKLIVDPKSAQLLRGAMLDYQEGLMGSGFAVRNPQVKGTCGCGSSFQV